MTSPRPAAGPDDPDHARALRLMTLAVSEDWPSVLAELRGVSRPCMARTLTLVLLMASTLIEQSASMVSDRAGQQVTPATLWSVAAQAMQRPPAGF